MAATFERSAMLRSFFARDLAASSTEVARLEALKSEAEDLIAEAMELDP